MLNSLFIENLSIFSPYSDEQNFKTFMKWARKSPHLMGFLGIINADTISDNVQFIPMKDVSSGRNKVIAAEKFWNDNSGVSVVEETLYDMLIDGIGYNWFSKLSDAELDDASKSIIRILKPELAGKELMTQADGLSNEIKKNRPDKIAKKLRHIAASTVTMRSDGFDVTKYIQCVGVNVKEFNPDEVITFKLIPFDGKIYPFPPMEAILSEVYLLWLITQNNVSFFENGGKPDNAFILPKEIAGSKNHEYLIDTLTKYKKIQNRHGQLVFTGDLTIEKLMEVDQQMENKDLGLYLVGILAMMYGIPVSRIPFLVGKSATGGDAGGLSDSGYWRKISVWQSKIENAYNKAVFNPFFGVNMKFKRGYLQDDVRETQVKSQMASVCEQMMRMGLWTPEIAGRYMGVDPEDVVRAQEEKKIRDEEALKTSMMNQKNQPNEKVFPEEDKQKKNTVKSETQKENKRVN